MIKIKITLLFLQLLLPTIIMAAPLEREWIIVIENKYERNKKIWGTYGQVEEKTTLKKKRSKPIRKKLAASMILKDGKMILINPVAKNGITSYTVKKFSYKKNKRREYKIHLKNENRDFLDLYKSQLTDILKKNKVNISRVDWTSLKLDKMSCKSKRRSFSCKTPLSIRMKPNS